MNNVHVHRYDYGTCFGCGYAPGTNNTSSQIAIESAIEALTEKHDPSLDATIAMLTMIRDQLGCEELDPACRDGKLTTFMDIVIFG